MIVVINWKYVVGSDSLLDTISCGNWSSVKAIAEVEEVSVKTLQRRLAKLEDDGLLVRYRYQENNFVWMIGEDAKENWNKYDALHIAKYRKYLEFGNESDFDGYTQDEVVVAVEDVPVFPQDKKRLYQDNNMVDYGKDFVYPDVGVKLSESDRQDLNKIVEDFIKDIK